MFGIPQDLLTIFLIVLVLFVVTLKVVSSIRHRRERTKA